MTIDTATGMRRAIAAALGSMAPAVTIDVSEVTYIDMSGLATLVEAVRSPADRAPR